MKQIATQAVILRRINFGEADRILTVLTKESGQLSLLAKGVRKSKSKLAGGLELFSVTDINYIDGKSDLKTIVSTRLDTYFRHIVEDVDRTMAGYDYMKSISFFSQHTDQSDYYNLLVTGLQSLDNTALSIALIDTWFYTILLQINGSGINVENPLGMSAFLDDQQYDFSFEDMSFVANKTGQFMPTHIKFLRLLSRADNPVKLTSIINYNAISFDLRDIIKQVATMHKA